MGMMKIGVVMLFVIAQVASVKQHTSRRFVNTTAADRAVRHNRSTVTKSLSNTSKGQCHRAEENNSSSWDSSLSGSLLLTKYLQSGWTNHWCSVDPAAATKDDLAANEFSRMRQHVIVIRGRFATWESLVLDLDIMVEVHVNMKEWAKCFRTLCTVHVNSV